MGLALLFAKSAPARSELAALRPPCRGPEQLEQDLRDMMRDAGDAAKDAGDRVGSAARDIGNGMENAVRDVTGKE